MGQRTLNGTRKSQLCNCLLMATDAVMNFTSCLGIAGPLFPFLSGSLRGERATDECCDYVGHIKCECFKCSAQFSVLGDFFFSVPFVFSDFRQFSSQRMEFLLSAIKNRPKIVKRIVSTSDKHTRLKYYGHRSFKCLSTMEIRNYFVSFSIVSLALRPAT